MRRAAPAAPLHALHLSLMLLVPVLAWDLAGLDLAVMRWLAADGRFAWREHWLTSGVLHQGGRWLAGLVLAALVANIWRPLLSPGCSRAERVRWLLATLACLALIPALKQLSPTSCPWDLAEFGGRARYVPHWQAMLQGLADGGPGGCFPAGHASAAFAFIGGWFVLRRQHPRRARAWLAGVLACGLAFGLAQTLRGAHYPSHTLWTAWLCWALGAALLRPPRAQYRFGGSSAKRTLAPATGSTAKAVRGHFWE